MPCVGLLANNNIIKIFIDLLWYLVYVRYLISNSRLMVQTAYDSAYTFERKYDNGKLVFVLKSVFSYQKQIHFVSMLFVT